MKERIAWENKSMVLITACSSSHVATSHLEASRVVLGKRPFGCSAMISALYPYCEQMRNAVGWPQSCLRSSTPWRIDAGIVSRSRTNSTWLALSAT